MQRGQPVVPWPQFFPQPALRRPGIERGCCGRPADVAHQRRTTVVVAHSYGGIVTAQAAAGVDTVLQLLPVSSYLPEPGGSLSCFGDGTPAPFLELDVEHGTFGVRPDALADTFLRDCSPEIADEAVNHVARQSLSVTQQPVTASAWQQVPSTYLVCTQDRGTPVTAQRKFARRANSLVEIDSGHHPFPSQPEAVADLISGSS